MKTKSISPKQDWEKELHEKSAWMDERDEYRGITYQFVDFIHSLLASERKRIREEVEKLKTMKPPTQVKLHESWKTGKIGAINYVLKLLSEENK